MHFCAPLLPQRGDCGHQSLIQQRSSWPQLVTLVSIQDGFDLMVVLIGRQTMGLMVRQQSQNYSPAHDLIVMEVDSKMGNLPMVAVLFHQQGCLLTKGPCQTLA